MTYRQQWQNIMHYGDFDRMPVIQMACWTETRERWIREGMPEDADSAEYFNALPNWAHIGPWVNIYPKFEEIIIEETDDYCISRSWEGVVQKASKKGSSVPQYIDYTFKTAADWPEYKKRLMPDLNRLDDSFEESIRTAESSELPIAIGTGSLMGWTRNWMGVENMSYLMHDDRDCYAEIVDTLADLMCWAIDQVAPRLGTPLDMGFGWEDICYRSGPLVSLEVFNTCVAPGYTKIRNKLEEHGTHIFGIDTDGRIEPLLRSWLDAGVNLQSPVEVGVWKTRVGDLRRQFGRELRFIGGFDKMVLEQDFAAIEEEMARHLDTMREGGHLIWPDHIITPGTSLKNYKHYLDLVRDLRF